MISNIMNKLMMKNNNITLLTQHKYSNIFICNLKHTNYKIIKINENEIITYINNNHSNYDIIFIRNHNILNMLKNKEYLYKTILYGLDIHLDSISKLNNKFNYIITQSNELKNKYIQKGIISSKIYVLEPITFKYEFDIPKRNDNEIRLIYCGTLRDEENILEIIEEFQKIHKERPEVVFKIIYGKIHGDVTFTKKVNEYIKYGVKGITFKNNLSHKDACCEIATSDIGICWRKNGWGDNGEVSTKVKEYEMDNIKLLTNNYNINVDTNILYFQNSFNKYYQIIIIKH